MAGPADPSTPTPLPSMVASQRDAGHHERLSATNLLFEIQQWWKVLVGVPFALVAIVVTIALVLPRKYTASVAFAPQSSSSSFSRLSGVAAQLGINVPPQQANESPDFYADLITSRHVLEELVGFTYQVGDDADMSRESLIQIYGIRGSDSVQRRDLAVRRLREEMQVAVNSKTGVVTVQFTAPDPHVASQVTRRTLDILNQYNVQRRQSQARAERRFVEARLEAARSELKAAEDGLQEWLQQNRNYRESPRLLFEYQRLQRTVNLNETVMNTLAQSFEQTRIEEVRDTPVLNIVDEPSVPSRPDSRHILAKSFLAIVLGGILSLLAILVRRAIVEMARTDPDSYEQLKDITAQWRLLRRKGSGN